MPAATDDFGVPKDEAAAGSNVVSTTRWSFSPMQAIPRNAEALWNLVDSVYFASIPTGHELFESLKLLASPNFTPVELPMRPGCSLSASFSYKLETESEILVGENPTKSGGFRLDFAVDSNGAVSIISTDVKLPPIAPPSRRLARGKEVSSVEAVAAKWKLMDASIAEDESMVGETEELAYLEAELERVRNLRKNTAQRILAKIESEVRPNKKAWFEAEQNLLSLYDRKPPSSFLHTSSSCSAGGVVLPLSKLGKVDSSLPDSFKDAELCCSICGEGDTTDDNDILICDGCLFAAHQSCYFVKKIPESHWFCQLCSLSSSVHSSRSRKALVPPKETISPTACCLCLQSWDFEGGGLMKPLASENGAWAHVKCAVWVPEAAFPADGLSISVIQNSERQNLRCSICKLKGGSPLQCAFGKCTTAFHVSCAARTGLLPDEKSLKNLYCARHAKIQLQTSPSISRLMSIRKQDFYLKVINDRLVAPKIGGGLEAAASAGDDGKQCYLLQIANVHPLFASSWGKSGGFVGPRDLMEDSSGDQDEHQQEVLPLLKDLFTDLVFPDITGEDAGHKYMNLFTEDMKSCCSECMRPVAKSDEGNFFKCDSCGLFCHSLCGGRPGVPAPNIEDLDSGELGKILKWNEKKNFSFPKNNKCLRCSETTSWSNLRDTYCVLCMQIGGLVLPIQKGEDQQDEEVEGYVHPRCLWWMLPSSMVSLSSAPLTQIKSISSSYHFHPCAVCGSRLGCTVKCSRVGCGKRFHVSCGFHAGCFFTVRTTNGLVAGTRDDTEDELSVLDNLNAVVSGNLPFRRVVTCWNHEQRGMRRVAPQLGRAFPHRVERIRWVPTGIRSELISVVNQVLSGEIDSGGGKQIVVKAEQNEYQDDEAASRRKRRRKKELSDHLLKAKVQTVRFVDGMEVTCQDEDWEGGCALCAKAWTDSKGQILESICCDKCDQWFHFACVGISKAPSGEFVCPNCL